MLKHSIFIAFMERAESNLHSQATLVSPSPLVLCSVLMDSLLKREPPPAPFVLLESEYSDHGVEGYPWCSN